MVESEHFNLTGMSPTMQIHLLYYEEFEWSSFAKRAAIKFENATFQTSLEIYKAIVGQEIELLKSRAMVIL